MSNEEKEPLPRDRCPICGHCFEEVGQVFTSPTAHYGENEFTKEDLITEEDDYAWCI